MRLSREPFAGGISVTIVLDPIYWIIECVLKCNGVHVGALKPQPHGRLVFVEHGQATPEEAVAFIHQRLPEVRKQAIAEMLEPAHLN